MDGENSLMRPSGLRPPSKLASFSQSTSHNPGLHEMSESQSNTRAQQSMLPQAHTLKRGLPVPAAHPEPKQRKTLAERAGGEFPGRPNSSAASSSRGHIRGTSLKDAARPGVSAPSTRQNAYSSNLSRHTSSNSYAASVGPGSRSPTRTARMARPATSMAVRDEEPRENAWDVDAKFDSIESEFNKKFAEMQQTITSTMTGQKMLEEDAAVAKAKAKEFEQLHQELAAKRSELEIELDEARQQTRRLQHELEDEQRARRNQAEDLERDHKIDLERMNLKFDQETDELLREQRQRQDELEARHRQEMEVERARQALELEQLRSQVDEAKRSLTEHMQTTDLDLRERSSELERASRREDELMTQIDEQKTRIHHLDQQVSNLEAQLLGVNSDQAKVLNDYRDMQERRDLAEKAQKEAEDRAELAMDKLIKEETRRRRLFDQLQTLKGNIRVMCRIRPAEDVPQDVLEQYMSCEPGEYEDFLGKMTVTKERESAQGSGSTTTSKFDFERIFSPSESNSDVFTEISQLVQCALDGSRVCIFAYGQTGSGKTYTMSSGDGAIIPSAVAMIYAEVEKLREIGWEYTLEGSYIEVYNEKLYDLLSSSASKLKEPMKEGMDPESMTLTVPAHRQVLNSPEEVAYMLDTAMQNRTVASTNMNRESSRSHCVFTLRLSGVNSKTGKTSEGILNLIDLAGSERMARTGAQGAQLEESKNINLSLFTLRLVMEKLAEDKPVHVPYKNSKLTRLLESCLGGNAKTLMFVMVSPRKQDLDETVNSLGFATTVSKARTSRIGNSGPKGGSVREAAARKR